VFKRGQVEQRGAHWFADRVLQGVLRAPAQGELRGGGIVSGGPQSPLRVV